MKKENNNILKFDSIIDDDHFHNANGIFIKDDRYFYLPDVILSGIAKSCFLKKKIIIGLFPKILAGK